MKKIMKNKWCYISILFLLGYSIFFKCSNIKENEIFSMLFIISITLLLLYFVNGVIYDVIEGVKNGNNETNEEQNNMDYNAEKIGFIERILFFIGIISQNWTLISIVVVFKTIARYKKIDEKMKAEYFLIGSLLSLLFAIVISFVFIAFDKIHNLGMVNYILSSVTYNLKIVN